MSVLVSDPPVHGTLCPDKKTDHRGRGEGKGDKTGSAEKIFSFFTSLNHHHKTPKNSPENDATCSVLHHVLVLVNSRYRKSSPCSQPYFTYCLHQSLEWVDGKLILL